jgi:hypothetical protein
MKHRSDELRAGLLGELLERGGDALALSIVCGDDEPAFLPEFAHRFHDAMRRRVGIVNVVDRIGRAAWVQVVVATP